MQFLRDIPIRRKLLWVTLITCGAALALACTALFWFQSLNFRRSFVAELRSLGAVVAQNSAAPLAFDDSKSAEEVLSALRVRPHIISAAVIDADGKLLASFGTGLASGEALAALPVGEVLFEGGDARLVLPILVQDAAPGRLQLRANYRDLYGELLSLYGLVLAAVLAGSLVVILLVSAAMQGIITRPIAGLVETARKISEREDYSTRAIETGKDEVGLLTRTFNQMLEQIESRDHRLRESRQRYEVAVMGSSDGLWDWDLVSRAVYYSPRWKSMLGHSEAGVRNELSEWEDRLHPDDREETKDKVRKYLAGGLPTFEIEFRMRHKDGSYRWILCRGAALRDASGKPVRFAGSHTDITERKKAEEEIRVARKKFESLVNSIHGIVWEADPGTRQMLFVSDHAEQMLGYPPRAWLEEQGFWEGMLHDEDRGVAMEAREQGIAARKPYQHEYRVRAADGRTVWLRENVSVELDGDRPVRLRGVALDITEQKLAAEQISRMQRELVEASRMAGMAEVATGVLHNVGNVLNSVNVSATLIVEEIRRSKTASFVKAVRLLREHGDDAGEFLSRDPKGRQLPAFFAALADQLSREQALLGREAQGLQENIEHIKQIVNMQQSYAKVSGAREQLRPQELVEDAWRIARSGLERHQIKVVREYEVVPPLIVDRHLALQILVNLFNNAKHALEHRLEGRRLTLRIQGSGNGVRIEVADNGVGIARENLTRIFRLGFTTKANGHGFGLHSGANSARQMGGSLNVRSDGPGMGATFILELPHGADEGRHSAGDSGQPTGVGRAA
ncbi:MAG TPA: hypothetical protein DCY13_15355 [Verrucomicrobiales bacterium]|nr:hypothetical protein [Verrucomicrobiales bacterium]